MTYERKIDIMVAAFCAAQGDRGEAWEAGIRKGLIDGFLRIRRLEMAAAGSGSPVLLLPGGADPGRIRDLEQRRV